MSQDESRRFPRIPSQNSVLVQGVSEGSGEAFVPTRTISLGGCSFLNRTELAEGQILQLLISVDQRVVKAKAQVVYSRPSVDDRWEVGVQFGELDPGDREIIGGLLEDLKV